MDERKGAIMRKNFLVKVTGPYETVWFNVYTNSKKAAENIGKKMYANAFYCYEDAVTYAEATAY